jgi:hypothetical protein
VNVIEILRKNSNGTRSIDYAGTPRFQSGSVSLKVDAPLHRYRKKTRYQRDGFYGMHFTAIVEYQLVHDVPEPVDPEERAEARMLVRERKHEQHSHWESSPYYNLGRKRRRHGRRSLKDLAYEHIEIGVCDFWDEDWWYSEERQRMLDDEQFRLEAHHFPCECLDCQCLYDWRDEILTEECTAA